MKRGTNGPFGSGMFGGDFVDTGRLFRRHGGLRYYMLWLVSSKSMNGAEIISEIMRQTGGWWRPSPGSIYPLLSTMEANGLLKKREDGRYDLTDRGMEVIGISAGNGSGAGSESDADKALDELESYAAYLSETLVDVEKYRDRLSGIIRRLNSMLKKVD